MDVKHHVYLVTYFMTWLFAARTLSQPPRGSLYTTDTRRLKRIIVQELCESRGGRPGLSVLTSLLVSVDVKLY